MYSFAGIANSKNYKIKSLGPASGAGSYEDFFKLRQLSPKSKLILSIGGWAEGGQNYSDMVSSADTRKLFIDGLIETAETYEQFDGFDLDWEYPGATDRQGKYADKENFLKLIQELRARLDSYERDEHFKNGRKLELSMAVPVAKFRLQEGYEVYELCRLMDFVNLMTYDLRGNWAGVSNYDELIRTLKFKTIDSPVEYCLFANQLLLPVFGCPHPTIQEARLRRVGLRISKCCK